MKFRFSSQTKWLFKLLIACLFVVFIWLQFKKQHDNKDVILVLKNLTDHPSFYPVILTALFLIPVNYILEALKWKRLLKQIENISFFQALRGIFIGVMFSIFTPARLGELGGRVLVIKDEHKLAGAASILVGSVAQNLMILTAGIVGVLYLLTTREVLTQSILTSMISLCVVLLTIGIYVYFNIGLFIPLVRKIKLPESWRTQLKKLKILSAYSNRDLRYFLFISLLRISIWAIQYGLVMYIIANVEVSFLSIAVIFCIFLFQSGLPLPPVLNIFARSGIAVYCWGLIDISEWNAVAGTFVMYFLNLIIPSGIGFFVFMVQNQYDQ